MVLTLLTQLLLNCLQEFNLGLRYWHEQNLVDIFFCYLFDLVSYKVINVCRIYLDGSILWKMSGLPMKLKYSWVNRHTLRHVKFPWSDDYTVDRNFWLRLVCLDPTRKGWLTEQVSTELIF